MTLAPLLSSAKHDWRTPSTVLDLVRQVAPIELDPCAHPEGLVKAEVEYRLYLGHDGLEKPWGVNGLAFLNPPYGRHLVKWMAKAAREARLHADCLSIIALVPARTDTRWWSYVETAAAICFWRGRIRFEGAPGPSPFPSALAYFGQDPGRFAQVFAPHGWLAYPGISVAPRRAA